MKTQPKKKRRPVKGTDFDGWSWENSATGRLYGFSTLKSVLVGVWWAERPYGSRPVKVKMVKVNND